MYPFPSKSILPLKCTFVSLIHEFWWLFILMWPHLFAVVLRNKQLKGHRQKWPVMRLASELKIDKYDSVYIRIWSMSKNDNWWHQIITGFRSMNNLNESLMARSWKAFNYAMLFQEIKSSWVQIKHRVSNVSIANSLCKH